MLVKSWGVGSCFTGVENEEEMFEYGSYDVWKAEKIKRVALRHYLFSSLLLINS